MSRIGIKSAWQGGIDMAQTAKVAQGTAQTADASSNSTSIIFVGDQTAHYVANNVVQSPADGTWHRISSSVFGAPNTTVTVEPAPATAATWDGQSIQAYKGQLQLLTEGDFVLLGWFSNNQLLADNSRIVSNEVTTTTGVSIWASSTANRVYLQWDTHSGSAWGASAIDNVTYGSLHSIAVMLDRSANTGWFWIDAANKVTDSDVGVLKAGNPEYIRLGDKGNDFSTRFRGGYGPHALLDLSSAGLTSAMGVSIVEAWHSAEGDIEAFCTGVRSILSAGESVIVYYWKLNELGWGSAVSGSSRIHRYSRTVTDTSIGTESDDATDGNLAGNGGTGICLGNSADQFQSGGYYLWPSQTISFGDHADFSFTGSGDVAFSGAVWTDAAPGIADAALLKKEDEYAFEILSADSKLRIELEEIDGVINIVSDAIHADGTLHLFGFTYSGSGAAAGLTLYVDGVEVASTPTSAGAYVEMPDTANALQITSVNGMFYGAALIKKELSASEMLAVYRQGPYV